VRLLDGDARADVTTATKSSPRRKIMAGVTGTVAAVGLTTWVLRHRSSHNSS
jgi:hypothetical protein